MEPISWSIIAGLLVQYGIPMAERIWQRSQEGTPPTQNDFDELKAMASETPDTLLRQVLAANGVAADDPRALEFFKLIAPKNG